MNANFFRPSLLIGMENISFAISEINTSYLKPCRFALLDTTADTAAATEVITWANLTLYVVILQGVSYVGHTGDIKGYLMCSPLGPSMGH